MSRYIVSRTDMTLWNTDIRPYAYQFDFIFSISEETPCQVREMTHIRFPHKSVYVIGEGKLAR